MIRPQQQPIGIKKSSVCFLPLCTHTQKKIWKRFKHGLGYEMTVFLCRSFMAVYWEMLIFEGVPSFRNTGVSWCGHYFSMTGLIWSISSPGSTHLWSCTFSDVAQRDFPSIPIKEKWVERMHCIFFMSRIFQNFSWASYRHFWRKNIIQEGVCSITCQKPMI